MKTVLHFEGKKIEVDETSHFHLPLKRMDKTKEEQMGLEKEIVSTYIHVQRL